VLEVKLDKKQIALTMKSERPAYTGAPQQRPNDGPRDRRPSGPPNKPSAPPPRANVPFNNPFAAALGNKLPRR
jgi:hypothetical protein